MPECPEDIWSPKTNGLCQQQRSSTILLPGAVCSSKWWHRQLSRVLSAGRTLSLCSLLRKMDREIQSIVDLIQPFWWNHAHLVNGCMFKTLCCLNEYLWHTHSWGPSLPKPQSSDFGNQIYPKPLPSEGSFSLCPLCIMNRWSFC